LIAGKDNDKDKGALAEEAGLADEAELADEAALTGEGSGTGERKGKGKKGSSAVVEKSVLGPSSDPTSSLVGQCAPSPGSIHEQAADVDSNLDLADDLAGARVALMDVDDEFEDDYESEDDGELENGASFARASAAAQGAHIRFNETTDEHATSQDNSAAPEAGDSATDKGNGKDKRNRNRNRKGKGNKEPILDQFPDPSSTPVERPPSSSGSHHEQATDVDSDPHPDGARVASTDDDNEAGWTKIEEKGKGKVKKA
jgi:hypothetical protein